MEFKIEITCHNCNCKFQLRPACFSERESLFCPNCGKQIDRNVFSHLQAGVKELALVPDTFPEGASHFDCDKEKSLQFTFQVKECDLLGRDS